MSISPKHCLLKRTSFTLTGNRDPQDRHEVPQPIILWSTVNFSTLVLMSTFGPGINSGLILSKQQW
ncbi:hypothetical protein KC19_VG308800 [Ceratodon purpureus]|uniref:Uncharacterized protein n=1 Tax=Ceratodon purpureus TaxID=3225 RepID=A0A8T0HLW3_CERPU|nr:hypothetical protein KC19_VG041800 [Ceratodon purpureus]KAG0574990.1 hypothetical protein KC19_VG308800 [Ceratodon purpureus]